MISLKLLRSRHFNNVPLNASNFIFLSSISRRPFSCPAESAEEKTRSFTQPLSGFFRRVIENAAETKCVVAENENAESRLDRLRNLEEQVRRLNKEKRESAEKLQSLSEESDSAVAPTPEKKRRLSELFANVKAKSTNSKSKSVSKPAPESESASELFASERKGKLKSNSKSKSVSKPAAESESAPELAANEKKGQSKSKPNSKSKSVSMEKTALVDRTVYGMEDPMVHKELSSDMKMYAEHLYVKGYLKDATFLPQNKFDLTRFEVSFAREFLKFVSKKFGEDHPDVARWLSAGDLKKIALFGCPNVGQRSVFAAKHMRKFFKIDEHTVCQACTLKDMCKHPNKISRNQSTNLHLPSVMNVLIMYALESVPKKLVVPEEVKSSVSRSLKEIVSLSQEKS